MRSRIPEEPSSEEEIKRIIRWGAPAEAKEKEQPTHLIDRLRHSCYLAKDPPHRALSPRERLVAQYRKDGLVLFLGAGLSEGSGIPNWNSLIKDMFRKVGLDPKTARRAAPSSIYAQFDLVALRSGGQMEFCKNLYHCLYHQARFKRLKDRLERIPFERKKQRAWSGWTGVRKELAKNKTLGEVGDLLILDDSQKQARRNPQIHAVLNVNVDNLLEVYCLAKTSGNKHLLTMVDRASVGDHPDAIPVYHLHGVLDARDENFRRIDSPCVGENVQPITEELLPRLVFRESDYFKTIADPASFVNHAPLSYFQRLNVLFIGTSLDDLNIRRWLYSSCQERVEQRTKYLQELYDKIYRDARFEAKLESVRHFWLRPRREEMKGKEVNMSRKTTELIDLVMRDLGVQVVWCNDFCDMQQCIHELRETGREPEFGRRAFTR
jgi:hypothetical protein